MRTVREIRGYWLAAVLLAAAAMGPAPSMAQDDAAQSGRVFSELTANWGADARMMLSELAALPTKTGGKADTKLPDMEAYESVLGHLQNLRTHTDIAVDRLDGAPPAASIGARSAKTLARELKKIEDSLSAPIKALYLAETPDDADKAVQQALGALTIGLQAVPEL